MRGRWTDMMRTHYQLELLGCLLVSVTLFAGCGAGGAGGLSDQLIWATNRLSVFGGDERTVTYQHSSPAAYWVVAAPAGTTTQDLAARGLPAFGASKLGECLARGDAIVAVVEAAMADCVSPLTWPQVSGLLIAAKGSGESTELLVTRCATGFHLSSIN